jgi:hypothetical protein
MEGRGEEGQGRKRGKGREEGGEEMIRNDRPSPHQKILDPPLGVRDVEPSLLGYSRPPL